MNRQYNQNPNLHLNARKSVILIWNMNNSLNQIYNRFVYSLSFLALIFLNNKIYYGLLNKDLKLNYLLIGTKDKLKMDRLFI